MIMTLNRAVVAFCALPKYVSIMNERTKEEKMRNETANWTKDTNEAQEKKHTNPNMYMVYRLEIVNAAIDPEQC